LAACSGSTETEEQAKVEPSPDSTAILSTIPAPESEDSDLTSVQQDAYDQISAAVGYEPELLVEMGLPRFLAPYLPTSSDDPETAARDFFEAYSGLYGIEDIDEALQLTQVLDVDSGGLVRFQQYLEDLPVYGGQAIVSLSPGGLISFVNSALQPTTAISMDAEIDMQQAVASAVEFSDDNLAELAREPQLMVFSPQVLALEEVAPSLVWEIGLFVGQDDGGPPLLIQYLVDALTGEIVFEVPEVLSAENWVVSSAQNSVTNDTKPKAKFDKVVKWYEMSGGELTTMINDNGQPLADAEGMAAQQNMHATWDYFFNTHDWDGHDDNGGTCTIYVHVGSAWENAGCGKDCSCTFGDGVGGWGAFLDVLAHEFTHAVVGQSAGLKYKSDSGALNEHYADFFAAMVETSDWLNSNPKGFRDLSDPPNGSYVSPDHYDEFYNVENQGKWFDNGWVHFNSGIPNKASFLVGDTGSNVHPDSGIEVQGLGRPITEQIWFDTLLTLGPTTSLPQWASSTVGATYGFVPDSLTEEDACQVQYAMQAVGLREPDCRCDDEVECPVGGYGGVGIPGDDSSSGGDEDTGEDDGTDTSPTDENGEETVTPEPNETMVNACDHPYMPIRPGSTWSYMDNEGQSSDYIVREVTGDENYAEAIVDAVIVSPELTVTLTHTWTCDREGIRAPLTSITGIPSGVEATVFGEEQGVLLPVVENLTFGSQWNYNTLLIMDFTSPDTGAIQVTNDRQEEFTSERMSNVSVPAGDFETLEISGQFTVTTDVGFVTKDFNGTEVLWFVEGVGLVKDLVEQDGTYFIELVDYFIPER
jgi:Zn-dependent metalloprotease